MTGREILLSVRLLAHPRLTCVQYVNVYQKHMKFFANSSLQIIYEMCISRNLGTQFLGGWSSKTETSP